MIRAMFAGAVLLAALPLSATAQTLADDTQPPPPPASQGPMTVERIHSGFLIAPEVKATRFDKKTSGMVGGSAGWVHEEALFVGGGGYWMASSRGSDRQMAYGGVVLQWFAVNGDRFGLSAKSLFGGGEATLPETVTQYILPTPTPRLDPRPPQLPPVPRPVTTTVRLHDPFLVAEPEVNARLALARHVRLALGAGYRFAGSDWNRRGGFDRDRSQRLSGATATFGVQIGG